ncbi:MAG: peptidylprolyl isomerase [Clostridia bacterium]|nr:peptidylprolyl isomerase [Clostridia bacterium]
MIIVLAAILLIAGVGIAIGSCNQEKPVIDPTDPNYTAASDTTEYVRLTVTYTDSKNVYRQGEIVVQLYSEVAPITVENFQKLVGEGFYNGLTFHRIYQGFMIQGGDPKGDGTGGSTPIKGEFNENGVINNLSHKRGVISMARRGDDMDSGSSQFFIVHEDGNQLSLDGKYAGFGEVVSGMSTVDGIAGTAVTYGSSGEKSTPINPITILKAEFVQKVG